jgi:hypothetical protein
MSVACCTNTATNIAKHASNLLAERTASSSHTIPEFLASLITCLTTGHMILLSLNADRLRN